MKAERVTLRAVAEAAGVSVATVSLALRDSARLPEETRRRVARVARRLGWTANAAVSRVMREIRSPRAVAFRETLGFLLPAAIGANEAWAGWLRAGLGAEAARLGYGLEEFRPTGEPGEARRLTRELRARGIRGLVLGPPAGATGRLELEWRHFAFVAIGYGTREPRAHRVARDVVHTLSGVYARLAAAGYRRIGFVSSPNNEGRVEGAALAAHLLHRWEQADEWPRPLLVNNAEDPALGGWLERERPDLVLSTVLGVDEVLGRMGYRAPGRIGYCSFNVQGARAPQTGIYADYEAMGAAAVAQVSGLLERGEFGEPERESALLVPGRWQEGRTIRKRR
jgi:LacI family transcriptional regulator